MEGEDYLETPILIMTQKMLELYQRILETKKHNIIMMNMTIYTMTKMESHYRVQMTIRVNVRWEEVINIGTHPAHKG